VSGPVDVLVVLRRMQHTCDLDRRENMIVRFAKIDAEIADEELEAIAAVAELIEAANAIAAHQDAATSSEWDRMNAALALVQGGAP
jgi:hypothetical protein